jgi:predicted AAA+ superfamily ATPase
MIRRVLTEIIQSKTNKAIIVLGPRQTGKTTLLNSIIQDLNNKLFLDCDDPLVRELLENANTERLRQIIGNNAVIFIDEAQRIKNIGLTLKIITDQFKQVQLYVSGSTSFELANEINEPLTGRKWEYILFPISWKELENHFGFVKSVQQLEQRLIFGMYPEIINNTGAEQSILKQITDSYLYKDILSFKSVRKPEIVIKLLKALAIQVGQEVSYNELANTLQIDKNTVISYIDLLEKVYIVYRLQPLSRNLRNEISTNRKIYFYDNGIRNALVANFNPLSMRQDVGALWENFLMSERLKTVHYNQIFVNQYFWRTKQKQEIDYIEERGGKFYAYEFKWNPNAQTRFSESFLKGYEPAETKIIHRNNFQEFLTHLQ